MTIPEQVLFEDGHSLGCIGILLCNHFCTLRRHCIDGLCSVKCTVRKRGDYTVYNDGQLSLNGLCFFYMSQALSTSDFYL